MRTSFRFLALLLFIILVTSCVQNHKVVLLQKDDVNVKGLPKDTLVRTYDLEKFDYRIRTNDIISVRFQSLTEKEFNIFSSQDGQPNTTMNLSSPANALLIGELVDENGEIPLPVIGRVKVAGLTIFEIQDKVQLLANQYLDSPVVKVRLLNFRFTILGEVFAEGTVTVGNNRISILEAIGLAGGLGDLADRANVKLIRQKGSKTEVYYINLLKEDFMDSPLYYLNQNDIIIVPPLKQRPYKKYFGQNVGLVLSSISLLLLVINLTK